MSQVKDILWFGFWSRGHNNPRYAELLPRLTRVDARQVMLSGNRYLLAIQNRVYLRVFPTLLYPFIFRWFSRWYECMWCTSLDQIPHFLGDIVVDMDDPRFTPYETRMLNHPRVCAVVTTTHLLREQLIREGVQKDILIMPQGVSFKDKDRARETQIARQYRGHGEIVIGLSQSLLSIGSSSKKLTRRAWPDEYDIRFLLDVMEHVWPVVPEAELWLLGRPHDALIEYVRPWPAIKLMGYVPRQDHLNYITNFDIAVYPRQMDFRGRFIVKLIEYMGCGVPIVSNNMRESFIVTEAGAGLTASSVNDFAEALIRLCRDPALRRELGENGRRFAGDYDWDAIAMRYEQDVFKRYFGSPRV